MLFAFEPVFPFQTDSDVLKLLDSVSGDAKDRLVNALGAVFSSTPESAMWLLATFAERSVQQSDNELSNLLLQDTFVKRGIVLLSKMFLGHDYWAHVFGAVMDEVCSFDLLLDDPSLLASYVSRVVEAMGSAPCCDLTGKVLRVQIPPSYHTRFFCSIVSNFLLMSVGTIRPQRSAGLSQNAMRACMAMAKTLQGVASAVSHAPTPLELQAWSWGSNSLPALVLFSEGLLSAAQQAMRASGRVSSAAPVLGGVLSASELAQLGLTSEEVEKLRFANKGESHLRALCARLEGRHTMLLRRLMAEEERELTSFAVEECLVHAAEGRPLSSLLATLLEQLAWPGTGVLSSLAKGVRATMRSNTSAQETIDAVVAQLTAQSEALPPGLLNLIAAGRELRRGRSHWAALAVVSVAGVTPLVRLVSGASSDDHQLLGPCLPFLACDLADAARVAAAQLALKVAAPLASAVERVMFGDPSVKFAPLPWAMDISEARQILDDQINGGGSGSLPVAALLSPKQKSRGELHPELQAVLLQQQRPKTVAITDLRGSLNALRENEPLYLEDLEELTESPRTPVVAASSEPSYVLCAQCSAANPRGFVVCRTCKKRHAGAIDMPPPPAISVSSSDLKSSPGSGVSTTSTSSPGARRLGSRISMKPGSRISEAPERRKSVGELDDADNI